MKKTPLLYFDVSIARCPIYNPNHWNTIYDIYVTLYGEMYRVKESYYLFFEYYGLKNLSIQKPKYCLTIVKSYKQAEKNINEISENIEDLFGNAKIDIAQQLYKQRDNIKKKIYDQTKFESDNPESQNLKKALFENILILLDTAYSKFVDEMSFYLAWDWFCNMQAQGCDVIILREMQWRLWNHYRNNGYTLPLCKIIDDFKILDSSNTVYFKETFKDLIDSEALTSVALEEVVFFTSDKSDVVENRIKLINQAIEKTEKTLSMCMIKKAGRVFCLESPKIPTTKFSKITLLKIIETSS